VSGLANAIALRVPGSAGEGIETLLTVLPFVALMAMLAWSARAEPRR